MGLHLSSPPSPKSETSVKIGNSAVMVPPVDNSKMSFLDIFKTHDEKNLS